MIVKTRAIAVRVIPFSETSRIVIWLTEDFGKVPTLIKGSQRPKSGFVGQYDLFYTCELLFYARQHQGLQIVRECSPLNARTWLRQDWRATACASYVSDLTARNLPYRAVHPEIFTFFDRALDNLAIVADRESFLFWYELKLMTLLGVSPQLTNCVKCHHSLVPDATSNHTWQATFRPSFFSSALGGILCVDCGSGAVADRVSVSPAITGLLRYWQRSQSDGALQRSRCQPAQRREMEGVLAGLMAHHVEHSAMARAVALGVVRMDPASVGARAV